MVKFHYNSVLMSLEAKQVVFPIGEKEESIYLVAFFRLNVVNNDITVRCEVIKNYYSMNANKRKVLFMGTAKECYAFIEDIVNEANAPIKTPTTIT